MSVKIPLEALPNQELQIILDGQNCTMRLYQKESFMYCDLWVDSEQILAGAMCLNCVNIVQQSTTLFHGYLFFYDTQGSGNPQWDGLKSRYVLLYAADEDEL